jgi:hypothetical protein
MELVGENFMPETIQTPRYPVASINLMVFNTGEVGFRYENLGPTQVVEIMLKIVSNFVASKFDAKQIIELTETEIPHDVGPDGNNGG